MSQNDLRFDQAINAPPTQVYNAFTNATALKEWLCDVATVKPKPGGRMYLAWNDGYYCSGEFTDLEQYAGALDCEDYIEDSRIEDLFEDIFRSRSTTYEKAAKKAKKKAKRRERGSWFKRVFGREK